MKKFRFRNFQVYKDARSFVIYIKTITDQYFPGYENYRLVDQIHRALNSVVLNIAEGSDKGTDKDFALYLNRSHGSVNEIVSCFDIALDSKYITNDIHKNILFKSESIANQLTAFRNTLLKH